MTESKQSTSIEIANRWGVSVLTTKPKAGPCPIRVKDKEANVVSAVVPDGATYVVHIGYSSTDPDSCYQIVSAKLGDKDIVIKSITGGTIYYFGEHTIEGWETGQKGSFVFRVPTRQEIASGEKKLDGTNVFTLQLQACKRIPKKHYYDYPYHGVVHFGVHEKGCAEEMESPGITERGDDDVSLVKTTLTDDTYETVGSSVLISIQLFGTHKEKEEMQDLEVTEYISKIKAMIANHENNQEPYAQYLSLLEETTKRVDANIEALKGVKEDLGKAHGTFILRLQKTIERKKADLKKKMDDLEIFKRMMADLEDVEDKPADKMSKKDRDTLSKWTADTPCRLILTLCKGALKEELKGLVVSARTIGDDEDVSIVTTPSQLEKVLKLESVLSARIVEDIDMALPKPLAKSASVEK